jgi:hypothetical protein
MGRPVPGSPVGVAYLPPPAPTPPPQDYAALEVAEARAERYTVLVMGCALTALAVLLIVDLVLWIVR